MSDEKIYHMLGSLWKTPTPPAPPAWQGPGSGSGVATGAPLFPSSDKLCMMIAMRMRWPEGRTLPMSYLSAHQTEDTVFVFMVHNKQAVVIEDEAIMFPSDALITKLRLMLG